MFHFRTQYHFGGVFDSAKHPILKLDTKFLILLQTRIKKRKLKIGKKMRMWRLNNDDQLKMLRKIRLHS